MTPFGMSTDGGQEQGPAGLGQGIGEKRDTIRVFLCDDVPEFRALMRFALEEDPVLHVVGEAGDGETAIEGVVSTAADVILLDLAMPDRDGLETIPRLREAAPSCSIIVLSGFSEARMGTQVRDAGANGYVEKGESFAGIRRAVRRATAAPDGG
ncbi:MAG: response regulator transcription factor [Actinobacteria bacterium]|nr:MAG: response regulator transcription factor [Actinomycetota bacterium]